MTNQIAVDLLSGEKELEVLIKGAMIASNEFNIPLILVGDSNNIKRNL